MTPSGRRRRWRLAVVAALVTAVLGGLYATGLLFYFRAQHSASADIVKNENVPPDHLEALARTISFNPSSGDLVVRVELRPAGSLAGPAGSVTRAVSVDVVGGTGHASPRYNPGDRMTPVDATIGTIGDVNSYPLDSYSSDFSLEASAAPSSTAQAGAEPAATPTALRFDGTLSGYRIQAAELPTSPTDVNLLALELTVKRAAVTTAFAMLILVLQALLAVAAASLAIFLVTRHRRVEIPMLTWLAALLFAIVPLRNAMPGAPAIGAEVDVIIFFWVVTVISVSLLIVLATWFRQPQSR